MFRSKKNLIRNSEEIHLEEIFLDDFVKKRDEHLEISDKRIETPLGGRAIYLAFFIFTTLLAVLWLFSFKAQIIEGEQYETLAQKNKYLFLDLGAQRGVIYDRSFRQLVWNEIRFDLYSNVDAAIIERDISLDRVIFFETNQEESNGLTVKKVKKRKYQDGLSHILGYLGKVSLGELAEEGSTYGAEDLVGREGLERSFEEQLREKKGRIEIERDALNREISRRVLENPKSGNSLSLHLDVDLQEKLIQSLSNVLDMVGSKKGAAVALDPASGGVLALVSLPSFSNNLFSQGISREELEKINQDPQNPQLNRVIAGTYPAGSTIKPLIAAAALEEGVITETTVIYCPLEICVEHRYTGEKECYEDWTFHGLSDVKRAIAESVNTFFYTIGGGDKGFKGLGIKRIADWLSLFGWGQETGIDLEGEVVGRIPTPAWKEAYFTNPQNKLWYLGDTYNLSIGQGSLLATPLQVAVSFSALVNGGKLLKPQLVKQIINEEKKVIGELPVEVVRQDFISQETLAIVEQGMRQAVSSEQGSAHILASLPVKAGAKTGTAQTSKKDVYHNWVTVFAPVDNPEIVLTVVIEEVKGQRLAALLVARDILTWFFQR